MHHYSVFTSYQLPDRHDLKGRHIWAIDIPRMAFHSDLVLDSVLGIGAQHLWALTPQDKSLAYSSRFYLDRALSKHQLALANADSYSAESLLASAILITHHTWVAAHSSTSDEPYVLPLQTYYMARGIQSLFDQMFPWLKGSAYLWYAEQQVVEDVSPGACPILFVRTAQEDMAHFSNKIKESNIAVDDNKVYHATLTELASMYSSIGAKASQHSLRQQVATMPLRLPPRFLKLVEQKEPIAMALLARNLALLKVIEPSWWLHGEGEHEVASRAVCGIMGLMPKEWAWAMDWPLKVISRDIELEE